MWIGAAAAVVFLVASGAAYQGRNKRLVTSAPYPTVFFALGWIAAGALALMLAGAIADGASPALKVVVAGLAVAGVAAFLVGLVGIVWMPLPLTPPWYRGWVARGRRWEDHAAMEHRPRWQQRVGAWTRRNEERGRRAGE